MEDAPLEKDMPLSEQEAASKSGKIFPCAECDKTYPYKSLLVVHMRSHTGEKPYVCSVCNKGFSRKGDITVHMRVHTGEKPFTCNVCEKTFSRKSKMIVHFRSHTGEKPFACKVCGKTFSRKSDVSSHEKLHTGEKPYPCTVCGKMFSQKRYVSLHMRSHTSDKPYPCPVCGKTFSRRGFVNQHMIIHTNEKRFACGLCGKTFCSQRNLIGHMNFHTGGEKRVPSLLCGKKKTHERYMAEYARKQIEETQHTQSGESETGQESEMEEPKPVNCGICGAVFYCWLASKKHLILHSDDRTSLCALCNCEIPSTSEENKQEEETSIELQFCSGCEMKIPKHAFGQAREQDCPECSKLASSNIDFEDNTGDDLSSSEVCASDSGDDSEEETDVGYNVEESQMLTDDEENDFGVEAEEHESSPHDEDESNVSNDDKLDGKE